MVIKPEPVVAAIEAVEQERGPMHKVLLSPSAPRFDQTAARRLAGHGRIALLCGRYEGIDDRVRENYVDECFSIGDFVLGGGEVAALVIIEAVSRLVEGVIGNPESLHLESFEGQGDLLEYPQYTRPAEFRGHAVPHVLLGGNHAAIDKWRLEQARARTWDLRPDLRNVQPLPEDTPVHLAFPATADPDDEDNGGVLEVGRTLDVTGLATLGTDLDASMKWVRASAGRPPAANFASLKQLRKRLRQRAGIEPWVVAVVAAELAHPSAIHDPVRVLDVLDPARTSPGRPLVLWFPGAGTARSLDPDALGLDAVYAPSADVGDGAQTHREPLETASGIDDSSRPPATLATLADRALRDLRNAGRPA
jgi:tRNA (guanine-N1)-methyltransferase